PAPVKETEGVTAQPFPADHFVITFSIFKTRYLGIVKLPVVIPVLIAPSCGGGLYRKIKPQRPAAKVQFMDGVVADLTGSPVLKPVPVVVDDVVFVRFSGGRALPQLPVQPVRYSYRAARTNRTTVVGVP